MITRLSAENNKQFMRDAENARHLHFYYPVHYNKSVKHKHYSPLFAVACIGDCTKINYPSKHKQHVKSKLFLTNRQKLIDTNGYVCSECGMDCSDNHKYLDCHHIIERSKGGSDNIDNLILLCKRCHYNKHKDEPIANIMVRSLYYSHRHSRI